MGVVTEYPRVVYDNACYRQESSTVTLVIFVTALCRYEWCNRMLSPAALR